MSISVCKGCNNRAINCHSTCELYITEKKKNDELRELRKRKRECECYRWNTNGTYYISGSNRKKNL